MGLQGYVGSAEDQARIRRLEREREEERARVEAAKRASAAKPAGFRQWQAGSTEVLESAFKKETVGLVTREEYVEKRKTIGARLEAEAAKRKRAEEVDAEEKLKKSKAAKERERKAAKLSFADEEEDDDADLDAPTVMPRLRKDDDVRTDFLPDADREREKEQLKAKLKEEWEQQQEDIKKRSLDILYSYWDGSGHQRALTVQAGDSVADFLKQARNQLAQDFPRLRHISIPNLIFVKDDVILPQSMTFYELVIGRVSNKGVQLIDFDGDAKNRRAHSAKVVERHWYESSKHIFPASRWEPFDEDEHVTR